MKITAPKLQVVRFASEDVIATSLGPLSGMTGLFYIPASQYSGTYSGSGNYIGFNGTLGNYSNGAYEITSINTVETGVDDQKARLESRQSGMVPMPEGFPMPASFFENLAHQTYDAFSYGNGVYYTNGVSYYESHWQ